MEDSDRAGKRTGRQMLVSKAAWCVTVKYL